MALVNNELVGEESSIPYQGPNVPIGIFLEQRFQENITTYGDAKWLTDVSTGQSMNYSQLVCSVRSIASALRKRDFRSGDTLAVIGSNFIELPLMSMAVWRAGGAQACLSVNLPSDIIEMRLKEIGNKFILTDYNRAGRVVQVTKRLASIKQVFVIGDQSVPGCTPFNQLLQDPGDECPDKLDDVDLDSMAWLAYTSGTTGLSKAIVYNHRSVIGSISAREPVVSMSRLKLLFVNPTNNTAGLAMVLGLSVVHADIYCMSDFSEENLLLSIDTVKPGAISLFPAHVAWICRHPHLDGYDLSSVKSLMVMGSCLNPTYERQIFDKFPNLRILDNVYGMSETGMICQSPPSLKARLYRSNHAEAVANHVFGSVGKVASHCQLKIVDPVTEEKLGPNQIGEIYVQSPFMLKEYLNKPKETADLMRNGWAHTGDKGYYDETGNVFVLGRYKELIKYRNMHVVPIEVEKHMMSHPAIEDVAVVGLPDDVDGERPMAFVVLSTSGQQTTTDEIIAFTNERVMDEEKLRGGVRFIDNIPRNDLGKIVRPELMKLISDTQDVKF